MALSPAFRFIATRSAAAGADDYVRMMPAHFSLGDSHGFGKIIIRQGGIQYLMIVASKVRRFDAAWNRMPSVKKKDFHEAHCRCPSSQRQSDPAWRNRRQQPFRSSSRVEIQDAFGKSLPGFALTDCAEIVGDEIERVVRWKNGPDVGSLAGQTVRLRFVMKDADLFSLCFR